MGQDESDEVLMTRIAKGDRPAFTRLVERYAGRAHAVAQRMLFNRAEAEDVVQEAFTRVWVHAPGWREDKAKFSTWFYRIVTNACIDSQRKKKTVALDAAGEVADSAISVEQRLMEGQKARQVQAAVAALPPRQRAALTLCYYEGLSNQAAAESMGVHLKALEALLVRARRELREKLAGMAGEDV